MSKLFLFFLLGTPGHCALLLDETFSGNRLPQNWFTYISAGSGTLWQKNGTNDSIFASVRDTGEVDLTSPIVTVNLFPVKLTMQHQTATYFVISGAILEFSLNGGAYVDAGIGGTFLKGGYDPLILVNNETNSVPLLDGAPSRYGWTMPDEKETILQITSGASGPANLQFRWRLGATINDITSYWVLNSVQVEDSFTATNPVPEPGTAALLSGSLILLAVKAWTKRKSRRR